MCFHLGVAMAPFLESSGTMVSQRFGPRPEDQQIQDPTRKLLKTRIGKDNTGAKVQKPWKCGIPDRFGH